MAIHKIDSSLATAAAADDFAATHVRGEGRAKATGHDDECGCGWSRHVAAQHAPRVTAANSQLTQVVPLCL